MKKFSILLLLALIFFTASNAHASETSGTITGGGNSGYAWSNQAGWVNFGATNSNIQITDSAITGYAWNNNYGWINMAPSNGGITIAANGALSGYAWGSSLGWINFSGVSINATGKFTGQASGTLIGTLTFDCTNCSVVTDYRPANFRTVATSPASSGSSSGGGGGGSGNRCNTGFTFDPVNLNCVPISQQILPPITGLDTTTFPPGVTPGTGSEGGTIGGGSGDEETLPSQLFDIRLLLDRSEISRTEDLVARVTFESFGRVPTPVEMTFSVIGADGIELWKSVDTTTVQTSAVFVKRLADVGELAPGSYTLRLHTLYNTNVEDDFEAPFTIAPKGAGWNWVPWFVGGLLLLLALLILRRRLIMHHRKEKSRRR